MRLPNRPIVTTIAASALLTGITTAATAPALTAVAHTAAEVRALDNEPNNLGIFMPTAYAIKLFLHEPN